MISILAALNVWPRPSRVGIWEQVRKTQTLRAWLQTGKNRTHNFISTRDKKLRNKFVLSIQALPLLSGIWREDLVMYPNLVLNSGSSSLSVSHTSIISLDHILSIYWPAQTLIIFLFSPSDFHLSSNFLSLQMRNILEASRFNFSPYNALNNNKYQLNGWLWLIYRVSLLSGY